MSCEGIRELIGADPDAVSPQVQAHLDDCAACRTWQAEQQTLNVRIRRALQIDPQKLPAARQPRVISLVDRLHGRRRRAWTRGLPIAGSIAAGLLVAFTLWITRPGTSLASEVVSHVEGEPGSWSSTQRVSQEQLAAVLTRSQVAMGSGLGPVVYASSCRFRGHVVPHLVVTTPSGPVTVMILEHERVRRQETFHEDGYSGLLVPAPTGSVAILSRTPMALEPQAAEVLHALDAANPGLPEAVR